MEIKMSNQFYVEHNVVRWNSSNNIPFEDKLTEFLLQGLISQEDVLESLRVRKIEDAKHIEAYIAQRQQFGYSEEEKIEMANAFAGETVVDIFTGQEIAY